MTYCKCGLPLKNSTGGLFCLNCGRKLRPSLAAVAEWVELGIVSEKEAAFIRAETSNARNTQTGLWMFVLIAGVTFWLLT